MKLEDLRQGPNLLCQNGEEGSVAVVLTAIFQRSTFPMHAAVVSDLCPKTKTRQDGAPNPVVLHALQKTEVVADS
jgi:hypothetical protein